MNKKIILFSLVIGLLVTFLIVKKTKKIDIVLPQNTQILAHTINLKKQNLQCYWKDKNGVIFKNFKTLKTSLEKIDKKLIFAMNAGMFKKDFSPQGLYIENGVVLSKTDTIKKAYANFYMQPNGVFYITNTNIGAICKTEDFKQKKVKFATQSGPLLVIDGELHSKFKKGSSNLNIRNGVGILPNGNLIFAMSKYKINFYDFAMFFKSLGCKNALYLDGFVSKTYLPQKKWHDLEGNFGVIIAEIE